MKGDPIDLHAPSYTPGRLLNHTAAHLRCPCDAQLAHALELNNAILTRVRKRQNPVSDTLIVRIMDRTGWSIQYVRELMGVPFEGIVAPAPSVLIDPTTQPRGIRLGQIVVLQCMPGTVDAIVRKSGYCRHTVGLRIRELRAGPPDKRCSHIIGWDEPVTRGPCMAIHQAGPGEDAVRQMRQRIAAVANT
jgi:hypothetical protein